MQAKEKSTYKDKKKWISITGLCNNNCIFCLDGARKDLLHKPKKQIIQEIQQGIKEKAQRLVLSGGDPTIHPDLVEFIDHGKKAGYGKIQIITNGRLLAYNSFLDKLVKAGLDEVTFSLHGHTEQLHDMHTRVNGSYAQIVQGIKNAQKKGLIVNTDTTITQKNYKYLPEIMSFIKKLGVSEANLMSIVPFGRGWSNKELVLYDLKQAMPYIKKTVELCSKNGIHLWLSRVPAEYLEGYEGFIWDNRKVQEELAGFDWKFTCKGKQCSYCSTKEICKYLEKIDKNRGDLYLKDNEELVVIDLKNLESLESAAKQIAKDKKLVLSLTTDENEFENGLDARKVAEKIIGLTKSVRNYSIVNIPQCFFTDEVNIDSRFMVLPAKKYSKDELAAKVVDNRKIKKEACNKCKYSPNCLGMLVPYVKAHGFKHLVPAKKIRSAV